MTKGYFFTSKNSFFTISPNPFPFFLSFATFNLLFSVTLIIHFKTSWNLFFLKIFVLIYKMFLWWTNFSMNYLGGIYTSLLENFYNLGFLLFMASEMMFFFGFFWSFFHSCWAPTVFMGGVWPPLDFIKITEDAFSLSKTMILLSSACTVTVAHKAILNESYKVFNTYLIITCILGMLFLFLQSKEYISSSVSMNSLVFSTTFFLLTGFHGMHVTVGLLFLVCTFFRFNQYTFSSQTHQGLEFAIWYWHFVDVVWLGLYVCVYHYSKLLYFI